MLFAEFGSDAMSSIPPPSSQQKEEGGGGEGGGEGRGEEGDVVILPRIDSWEPPMEEEEESEANKKLNDDQINAQSNKNHGGTEIDGEEDIKSLLRGKEADINIKKTPVPVFKIILVCAVIASSSFSYTMLYAIVGFMVTPFFFV